MAKVRSKLKAKPVKSKACVASLILPYKILGLLCLLFASVLAQANISLTASITVFKDDIQLHLNANEYRVLKLKKGEITVDVPVIKFSSQQAMSKGTIVLLGDLQMQQTASNHFYKLAKTLPNWGWNTILVTPKNDYFVFPPELENLAEDSAEKASQEITRSETAAPEKEKIESGEEKAKPINGETLVSDLSVQTGLKAIELQQAELGYSQEDYSNFMTLLLVQLNTTFLQQPGYRILIVEGKTAAVAIDLLSKESTLELNALVLNNPYWPEVTTNQALPKQLAGLQLPVLDLISFSDNHWSLQTQMNRVAQTRIMVKPFYRQREIVGDKIDSLGIEYLAREIVGWTRYLGW